MKYFPPSIERFRPLSPLNYSHISNLFVLSLPLLNITYPTSWLFFDWGTDFFIIKETIFILCFLIVRTAFPKF
jgi:hypothetical protein